MTALDLWLEQATRGLSRDSVAQVRSEIQEHYESAREAAMSGGSTAGEADRAALTALGDAKAANRQYRNVLLTSSEAKLLRDGNWEARVFCSWRWTALAVPVIVLLAGAELWLAGKTDLGRILLAAGFAFGFLLSAPLLPVFTPARARIFRVLKWALLLTVLLFAFGEDAPKYWWLVASSIWPLFWIERTRISIRRKLPVAKWPKQLYL